jgi:hypothetical protein
MASADTSIPGRLQRDFPMVLVHAIGEYLTTAEVFCLFGLCKAFTTETKKHPIRLTPEQLVSIRFIQKWHAPRAMRNPFASEYVSLKMIHFRMTAVSGYNHYSLTDLCNIPACVAKILDIVRVRMKIFQPLFRVMKNRWPPNLKHLEVSNDFDSNINVGDIPSGLETLVFGRNFNREIAPGVLAGIKHIVFGEKYDHFTQPGVLPEGLESLTFGCYYNQRLGNLPSTLRTLILHQNYPNILLPGKLPAQLQILHWGNFEIYTGSLPVGLQELRLGAHFSSIGLKEDTFRSATGLKTLHLGYSFVERYIRKNIIPDSVERIILYPRDSEQTQVTEIEQLPDSLKSIEFVCKVCNGVHIITRRALLVNRISRTVLFRCRCPKLKPVRPAPSYVEFDTIHNHHQES